MSPAPPLPDTLPADFFRQRQSSPPPAPGQNGGGGRGGSSAAPPDTLPADFFGGGSQSPKEGAFSRFIKGVGDTLNPMPLIKAYASPQGVQDVLAMGPGGPIARGIVSGAVDQGRKAVGAAKAGDYSEAAGHALAAALPGVGPMAANAADTMAGEPGKRDKYGNVADPGRAPDVARGVGQAAGMLAPIMAGEAAPAVADRLGIPRALRESAEKTYNQVLGPTTKPNKVKAAQVVRGYDAPAPDLGSGATASVPGLIDRGVTALTRKGLQEKFSSKVQDLGDQLDTQWDAIPDDQGIPAKQVYSALDKAAEDKFGIVNKQTGEITATSPEGQRGMALTAELKSFLKSHEATDPAGGTIIPHQTLRRFRQDWDNLVAASNGFTKGSLENGAQVAGYKAASNGIRELLNESLPDVAKINREYAFWKKASDVIGDTVNRTQSQAKPLGRKMARAAGQAAGLTGGGIPGAVLAGETMDALEALTTSPAWKTVSAVTKSKIADALARGNESLARGVIVAELAGSPQRQASPMLNPAPALQPASNRPQNPGDLAIHNGRPIRITAVHPDGTIDFEPIEQ